MNDLQSGKLTSSINEFLAALDAISDNAQTLARLITEGAKPEATSASWSMLALEHDRFNRAGVHLASAIGTWLSKSPKYGE